MKLKYDIRPITYMKQHSKELLSQVNGSQRPVVITQNGEARAVIQDIDSYEKIQNTFALLKLIAQSEQDFNKNRVVSNKNSGCR